MGWAGLGEDTPIEHSVVSKAIENAQIKVEGYHFDIRKHLVEYDDVINKHREVIYQEREKILSNADLKANIQSMIHEELEGLVAARLSDEQADVDGLLEDLNRILPLPADLNRNTLSQTSFEEVEERLINYADSLYEEREEKLGSEHMRMVERLVMLRTIDNLWIEHLTMMEQMRQGIGLRAVGHHDPLVVYKSEGHALFQSLLANIQHDVVYTIYHVDIVKKESKQQAPAPGRQEAVVAGKKVGRNDPCPCGSGKKYKKCCGK
jgi:preprotein translocase subunit SecA